jgi:hypothetical protein
MQHQRYGRVDCAGEPIGSGSNQPNPSNFCTRPLCVNGVAFPSLTDIAHGLIPCNPWRTAHHSGDDAGERMTIHFPVVAPRGELRTVVTLETYRSDMLCN